MVKEYEIGAIITDTHVTLDNFDTVNSVFNQLLEYCLKNKIYTVFHIGDWFTVREAQNLNCMLTVQKIIRSFTDKGIEIHTTPGNHDKPDLNHEKSYLQLFDREERFHLYNFPSYFINAENRVAYYFLPYFKDKNLYLTNLKKCIELRKYVDNLNQVKKHFLFTHKGVDGVRNMDGTFLDDGIITDDFKMFDKVICGHYHEEQILDDFIHFIGSSHQANFAEKRKNKGFYTFTNRFNFTKHRTTFPVYHKILVDATDKKGAVELLYEFEQMKAERKEPVNLRVIFKGTQQEIDSLDISKFQEAGIDVKKENIEETVKFDNVEDAEIVVFDKKNVLKGWAEYSKQIQMHGNKLTKGMKLLSGLKLIEK